MFSRLWLCCHRWGSIDQRDSKIKLISYAVALYKRLGFNLRFLDAPARSVAPGIAHQPKKFWQPGTFDCSGRSVEIKFLRFVERRRHTFNRPQARGWLAVWVLPAYFCGNEPPVHFPLGCAGSDRVFD